MTSATCPSSEVLPAEGTPQTVTGTISEYLECPIVLADGSTTGIQQTVTRDSGAAFQTLDTVLHGQPGGPLATCSPAASMDSGEQQAILVESSTGTWMLIDRIAVVMQGRC